MKKSLSTNKMDTYDYIGSVPIGTSIPPAPPTLSNKLRVAFNSTSSVIPETLFNIMHSNSDADIFRNKLLYEKEDLRFPSSTRLNLYGKTPCISMSIPVHTLSVQVQAFLRECICISTVFVLSTQQESNKDGPILLVFVEFPPTQDIFLLDCYISTINNNRLESLNWMWARMFPTLEFTTDPITVVESLPSVKSTSIVVTAVDAVATVVVGASPIDENRSPSAAADPKDFSDDINFKTESMLTEFIYSTASEPMGDFDTNGKLWSLDSLASVQSVQSVQLVEKIEHVAYVNDLLVPPIERLFPNGPYDVNTHKIFVILDLDKTMFVSDADCIAWQRNAFVGDVEIAGNIAITNERFQHKIMIRPGSYWFLRRLAQIAEIFVITAGDIHYARAAVTHSNAQRWICSPGQDPSTDEYWVPMEHDEKITPEMLVHTNLSNPTIRWKCTLPEVSIPLTRVFSVRNHAKRFLPKTLERALPFAPYMTSGANSAVLIVDDSPSAWDQSVRNHVIPISPFQPLNNKPDHLLHVAWLIEQAAERYFNDMHSEIAKLPVSETGAAQVLAPVVSAVPVFPVFPAVPAVSQIQTITIQFYDCGRYVIFDSGLTFDCSNGLNKVLTPSESKKFNAEHKPVGYSHVMELTHGIQVNLHIFNNGRYTLLETNDYTSFLLFDYGVKIQVYDITSLKLFLGTLMPLKSSFNLSLLRLTNQLVKTDKTDGTSQEDEIEINNQTGFITQFFNFGRYCLQTSPTGSKMLFDYANGGKPNPLADLSANPIALQEFLGTLIPTRKCDKQIMTLIKTKKIIDQVMHIINNPQFLLN
jgi:hypothetical protein